MKGNARKRFARTPLFIALAISGAVAAAAEPCPWLGTELERGCPEWDELAARLERSELRTDAAEQAMEAMEQAVKSMEQAVQSMAGGDTPGSDTPELKVITPESGQESADSQGSADSQESAAAQDSSATQGNDDPLEQRARAVVEALLEQAEKQSGATEIGQFILDRDYAFSGSDGTFTAVLAKAGYQADDFTVDIAPVRLSITPQDNETSAVELTVADSVVVSEDGEETARVDFGSQKMSGVWSERVGNFTTFTSDMDNVNVVIAELGDARFNIGKITTDNRLDVDDAQAWTQTAIYAISDLQVNSDEGDFRVAGVDFDITMNGSNYAELVAKSEEISKLAQNLDDPDEMAQSMITKVGEIFSLFGDFSTKMTANGLDFSQDGQSLGSVQQIGFASELDTEAADGRFGYSIDLDGINLQAVPMPPGLAPQKVRIELELSRIPEGLIERITEIVKSSAAMDEYERDSYLQQQMMGLLMTSDLTFQIKDSHLSVESARVDLSANASVDGAAAMGATGDLLLRVEGMQNLIDGTGVDADPSIAPMLAMITAFSSRTEEADGKTIDTFDLKFTADGKLMLNDKDITAMFMPGMAPQQ